MTNPPKNDTPDKALVEATQADRKAAFEHLTGGGSHMTSEQVASVNKILEGSRDYAPLVQAFARHRLAALSQPQHGGLVEADNATIQFISRYGGRCRECADSEGICSTGLPCDGDQRDAAIRHVIEAINYGLSNGYLRAALSNSPVVGEDAPAIPAGMKPWNGGDRAPDDWDGGETAFRDGSIRQPLNKEGWLAWRQDGRGYDIIAYTPKPTPTDTADLMDTIAADHAAAQTGEVKRRPYSEFRAEVMDKVAADLREAVARIIDPFAFYGGPTSLVWAGSHRARAAAYCKADAIASLIAGPPEGFVMVPVGPTEAMIEAGSNEIVDAKRIFAAMLAARPTGDA